MLDEKNLLCIDSVNAYDPLYEELEKHGVTVHALPWRTRGFWDGGMHCITLDIRRKSTIQDYFPNNEGLGVKRVYCNLFIDQDQFFNEYNDWKKNQ
jgi:hypothetical protein